jgi:hypothetical protein
LMTWIPPAATSKNKDRVDFIIVVDFCSQVGFAAC